MSTRTRIGAGVAAAGLLVAATVGANGLPQLSAPAEAARLESLVQPRVDQTPPQQPGPGPRGPGRGPGGADPEQRRQRQQDFINRLAGHLGVPPERVIQALRQTRIDLVNKAVQEGKLSQEQANQIIQRIQSGQGPAFGPGGRGPGIRAFAPAAMQSAAQALSLTPQQLRAELQAGRSLAEIAQARGVRPEDLKQRMIDAHRAAVQQAVSRGDLTQEQANQVTQRFAQNIDRIINAKRGQRQRG